MKIYQFASYRDYLRFRVEEARKGGRGQLLRMAKAAQIHSSVLSQVFQGQRELTPEQAISIGDYLELSKDELQYFLLLVQRERAGTERLRRHLTHGIECMRAEASQISQRLPEGHALSPEQKAIFYSNWYFTAARVLTSIPGFQTVESLGKRLRLPREHVMKVLDFLVTHGLCIEKDNHYKPGPQSTHLNGNSALVSRHHGNWRIKAIERHPSLAVDRELAFTAPLSLAEADIPRVREVLLSAIEEVIKITDPSPAETAYCLNIDWIEF